ncbi:MAG: urea transporter, partial [Rhizobiales bacterium]|nr:urea transporter [Hyphomicrobiales bacterium]
MAGILESWARLASSSPPLGFIDWCLRGIGQVVFQDNPLTGLFFLAAVAWASLAGGAPEVLLGGVLAVVVATAFALWLGVDRAAIGSGLAGYNAFLVGLALPTFLPGGPLLWLYVVLGAAVSVVANLAVAEAGRRFAVASLTAAFVLVTWLMLLASHGFAGMSSMMAPSVDRIAESNPLDLVTFVTGVLKSISQIFLKGSIVAALLFIAGLAASSLPAALFAVGGAIAAVAFAHLFGAESEIVTQGLLGFSPVLTAVAVGTVFQKPGWRVGLYALLA